ncbi:MAG TPA: methyltransferase [Bryobacteraceae bacterium]|nr:methyltransferase [Bryobacteraceae bacterium]
MIPLRLGSQECFASVRAFLEDAGYTESEVCRRLGVEAQHEVMGRPDLKPVSETGDATDLLLRLFLAGGRAEDGELRRHVPEAVLESMRALGLLERDEPDSSPWRAPVCLYSIGPLYIVSDRWTNADGSPFAPAPDIVYPALTKNTYRFLSLIPREPCRRLLELCSGAGAAALTAASGYACEAWAVDITERSTHFAEFNRRLNGLANVKALQGDLYQPLQGLKFDRIVAHPPYVPAASRSLIFQDAGEEGEEITRAIVAGLAEHLEPGGALYCLTLGADHRGEPLEKRVRGWIGAQQEAFDVMVAAVEGHTAEQVASKPLLKGQIGHREFAVRRAAFTESGIEQFVYGLIVVERIADAGRPAFTIRRQMGTRTGSAECGWALRWEAVAASRGSEAILLAAKPRRSGNLELSVIHRMQDGELAPQEFTLQAGYPFRMECKVHPWTVALLEACDGFRSGAQLHAHCRQQGWIHEEVAAGEFARFLGTLVSGGFLEVEGFEPPGAS